MCLHEFNFMTQEAGQKLLLTLIGPKLVNFSPTVKNLNLGPIYLMYYQSYY